MEEHELAKRFHELYEEMAPIFNYETRKESAKPWKDVPENNKALMVAVCGKILDEIRRPFPNEDQVNAGHRISSELITASLRKEMGALGGCKEFNIDDFEFKDIIKLHLDNQIDSVVAIWMAMSRYNFKNLPCRVSRPCANIGIKCRDCTRETSPKPPLKDYYRPVFNINKPIKKE